MKKYIISGFLTIILSSMIIGCGVLGSDNKITADSALDIAQEMITLSDTYPNLNNVVDSAAGATSVEIFDDSLNDIGITFGNDPIISKSTSLIVKMKLESSSFSFDSYPKYNEALNIYYGSGSKIIANLEDEINDALLIATTEPIVISPFKDEDKYIIGTLTLNSTGSYDLMFVCTNNY